MELENLKPEKDNNDQLPGYKSPKQRFLETLQNYDPRKMGPFIVNKHQELIDMGEYWYLEANKKMSWTEEQWQEAEKLEKELLTTLRAHIKNLEDTNQPK